MRTTTLSLPLVLAASVLLPFSLACGESQLDNKPAATVKDDKADGKTPELADGKTPEAPAEGTTYAVDPAQSTVGFVGAKVTADHEGKFTDFSGEVALAGEVPTALKFSVKIGSLVAEPEDLQKHLLSPDFFDAEKFPEAGFVSKRIDVKAGEGGATHEIEGDLTFHGVTKTIVFPAKVSVGEGAAKGSAEFKINRKDFGVEYPGLAEDLIKDDVLLKLDLVFPTVSA